MAARAAFMATRWLPLLASAVLTLLACTTTSLAPAEDAVAKRHSIDSAVDQALRRLYDQAPGAREMTAKAQAVLVFPSVVSAGLVVGGSYGQGALRIAGHTAGYYSTTEASIGLVAGAESKAIYLLFMTREALDRFRASKGWTVGADASVTLVEVGADAGVDTRTAQQPVVGYVLSNAGLMGNVSVEGAKVTALAL
jgi:lipid-binding SYLF domain-containing protein